ncbi:MAG: homoserine dehydrogenase [Chitinivibrionales bacterium]|nr:homoserine dehydrogenase [Chitinivibrionales bacterium]
MNPINVGLVGAGTIGGGVVKILAKQGEFFRNKLGLPIYLKRVADVATQRFANLPVGDAACSANADDVLSDDEISIVVELVGGTAFARKLVLDALNRKKHVVTANKALLAEYGPEIFSAAEKNNVSVLFEAAVGGGMPTIKTIREAMIGNDIHAIKTIINGTCNYILSQMSGAGTAFETVLAEAQANGYAEADPTLDIGGGDTGHKVAIMASLLYGGYVPYDSIAIEGITSITPEDIAFAAELGYCIKLLGIIKHDAEANVVDVRVHPAMLHKEHILASVNDVFNAVLLEGDAVGDILLYGKGAGEMPTASAVVGDIIDAARDLVSGPVRRINMDYYAQEKELSLKPHGEVISRFYLRFTVKDEPGVLATIAAMFGEHGISIASVMQKEGFAKDAVPVIFLTHMAREEHFRTALQEIEHKSFIKHTTQVIRIED